MMTHSALLAQARIWNKEDDRRSPSVAARAERREHRERSSAQAAAWQAQMETMRIPRARSGDTSYAEAELEARRSGKVISDVWEPLEVAVREARWAAAVRDLGNGRALSYAEVAERARRVGSWIAARVEPGATVGILAPNSATVIEAHFAIAGWAGCVALNCNPRLASDELSYCIEGATCRALVCDAQHASLVENALVSENGLEHELPLRLALWFRVTTQKKDVSSLIDAPSIDQHDYEAIAAESPATLRPKAGRASDDGAEMYYTSGTSGRPKGVVLSHEIVVLHALGCVIEHRLAASDVWLHAAPMFHLVDAYAMFAITWIGGRHVVIPGFAAETMAAAIRTHAITVSNVASTMVTLVLVNPAASAKENFTSLELFSCGGAPLARATTLDALDRFDCEFFLSYGMTESCGKISMSLVENAVRDEVGPRATLDLICSSGRPFSLLEVRVVGSKDGSGVPCEGDAADGDAVDVSPGTLGVGEVWIRGPTVFGGYLNNPKANAKAITKEGWFRTGDLATLNDHGYVTITDRAKDMILVGSENVYCVEVERVLHDHPGVKHACVYGVPDDALGERVKAAVMRKDEALTVSELRRHAASRLADFKVPSTIEFVTELPMTGSGKVAKAALKKRDAERAEARRAERAARRLKQSEDDQLAGHVYRIEWNLSPIASPVASSVPSDATWLLVREDGQEQLARELASKLTSRTGTGVSMISLNQTGDDEEDEAASLERGRSRLAAALTEIDVVRGVVVLATLEATAPLDSGMAAVTKSTRGAMRTLLAITQTLVEAAVRNVPVVVVTRGGADVRDSSGQNNKLAVPGYAVWGFCRSAAAEMPALAIKLVDLCPSEVSAGHDAEALYKEALAPTSSRESAWRRRQRLVPNLARFATTDNSSGGESLRQVAPGVHVVTGGTGGLGIEWARRLAAAGGSSATVILTSRRAVSAEVDAEVKGLAKQTKATILVQKADVSVAADAEALLSRANMLRAGSAMSVWHLAGVVDDGAVSNLSWSRFSKVLLPKVEGSLALHDAAATYRPDRFVMFSSIYGLLGSRELTHYGAANAFQDGLAAARAQLGLPGLAVSWGTWADAGMAHRFGAGFEAHVKATGMRFVPLGAGFATLSALSSQSQSVNHAAVLPADWAQYAKHRRALGGPHPLATKLAQDATASDGVGKDTTTTTTKAATPGAERRNASADRLSVLRDIATNAVKSLLGDDAPSQLDLDSPVSTLGLSSVHVVEFAILLGEALDMEISPTLIFECVSINGICGRVLADSEPSTTSNNSTAVAATRLLRKLESVRAGERVTVLMREVVRHVCGQVGEDANVDVDAPVATVGLSSIQVVELAVFLSAELDEAVSPTTFFEHVSISGVCTHLVDEVLALGDSRAPPQPTAVPLAREPPAVEEAIELQISSAACRLPGDVSLPSDLWHKVLLSGQDCVLDDPPTDRPHNGRASAYISSETLFGFDRLAFAISAAEAAAMDPQQRLMLECCAEALECGERRSTPAMPGGDGVSDVGVFAAIETSDYAFLHQRAIEDGSCANADAYCGTGWHSCVPPNRVSYLFDLRGPSIALNTACSSSLTCIAVARHSLHARECSAALVGGSNIQLQPNWTCAFLAAGMLSPTFRCRFGDDAADGYVRGEGVGVLLVEARKSGGGVSPLATVSGVGIGQDGRSNGLTAPNPSAQGAVLTSAYSAGGVGLRESVALIEAHGTGTRLGDPIELGALGAAGLGKPEERLLRCASIKTNIGHLEGCSGLAGLLKAILVQHQPEDIVPRSLHFKTPNTHVPWDRLRVSVVAEEDRFCPPLAAGGMQPAIGTSSFGFGGALGHVIISRMTPHAHVSEPPIPTAQLNCLPLAAHSGQALRVTAARLAGWVREHGDLVTPSEVAIACAQRVTRGGGMRAQPHRAGAVVLPDGDASALADGLLRISKEYEQPAAASGMASNPPSVVFAFTGQGSAYVGMGRALYESLPAFASAYDECATEVLKHLGAESREKLDLAALGPANDSADLDDEEVAASLLGDASIGQPALFVLEYALAKSVLHVFGLTRPDAVVGHSLGEIAAMSVAGLIHLSEAAALVCGRGEAMAKLPRGVGAMAAVRAEASAVAATLQQMPEMRRGSLQIAADNSTMGCTISGTTVAVDLALEVLATSAVVSGPTRKLQVTTGFHSSCVEPCLPALRNAAARAACPPPSEGSSAFYSTLTGERLESRPNSEYWCSQARGTVKFAPAMRTIIADIAQHQSRAIIVEIGPSAHLLPHIRATLGATGDQAKQCLAVSVLRGPKGRGSEYQSFGEAVAQLFACGFELAHIPQGQSLPPFPRLPPTAFTSPSRTWFSSDPMATFKRKEIMPRAEPGASNVPPPPLRHLPTTSYCAAWVPCHHAAAPSSQRRILVLRDNKPGGRAIAAALRLANGAPVTELPISAADSVNHNWDLVVFAVGLDVDSGKPRAPEQPQGLPLAPSVTEFTPLVASRRPPRSGRSAVETAVTNAIALADHASTELGERTGCLQAALRAACTAPRAQAPRAFVVVVGSPENVGDPGLAACNGALLGMLRSARREAELSSPNLSLRSVELLLDSQLVGCNRVAAEIMDPDREEDLRVESHQAVSARRVVPLTDGVDKAAAKGESEKSAAKVSVERLVNKGVIAITGGTGALGLIVAKYLIERGARRLMLLSRSGECRHADLPLRAELDDVAFRLNARIEVLRLDVSDGAAIHGFCVRRGTELTGVVHAAGVANDGMLASRTSSTLEQTLAPKLVGAMRLGMILDAVRRGRGCGPLALEVYFSSVTALVGNAGQTDYGTANAGLDALAAARRQQSRTRALVSIQWGPWADHGMASVAKNSGGGTSRAPFIPLGTTQALTHFDVALHRAFEEHLGTRPSLHADDFCVVPASVAIVRFDAKALRDAARNSAFVRKMTEQLSDERDIGTAVGVPTVAQSLKKVDPSATVLGIFSGYSKDADSQLNFATPVSALALDSLDAMAVVQELNATTGARFNVLDVLSAPTLGDIVQACPHATIEAMPVNGETEVAAPLEENPGDIAKIIAGIVAKHSARAEVVTSGTSLSSLALDSLEVTGIVNDINNAIGGDVNMVDALQAETIDDLIATARGHVSEASKAPSVASPDVQTMSKLTTSSVSIDIEGGRQCGHSGEHDSNNAELTPAKPLSEPSLSYRLYFTILSYILGSQIMIIGLFFVALVESLLPPSFALRPKVFVIDTLYMARVFSSLIASLLPMMRPAAVYPGLPGVVSYDDFVRWTPSSLWLARFSVELTLVLFLHMLVWVIGCHFAVLVLKWLVVGKQRTGVFPVFESSIGWRSALLANGIQASAPSIWTGPDCWIPSSFWTFFLRLCGAKIGRGVKLSDGLPVNNNYGSIASLDLLTIGDGVAFAEKAEVSLSMMTTPCTITHGHVTIGRFAVIGAMAEVRRGAWIGAGATVCAGSGAKGLVPPGGYALSTGVRRRSDGPAPPGACDTVIRVPPIRGELSLFHELAPLMTLCVLWTACLSLLFFASFMVHIIILPDSTDNLLWIRRAHHYYETRLAAGDLDPSGTTRAWLSEEIQAINPKAPLWYELITSLLVCWFTAILSFLISPWLAVACTKLVKCIAYGWRGLHKGDTFELTPGFVTRHACVSNWTNMTVMMLNQFHLYSGLMSVAWRALGMKLSKKGVIISEQLAGLGMLDLFEVADNAYLAARLVFLPARVDSARGVVHFDGISIGENCFVGPLSVLMPGTELEANSATGSCAVVSGHVRAGKIAIGDDTPNLMLGWRPKRQDAFDRRGERLWDVYSSVVLILHSFVVRVGCYAVPYMFLVLNCAYSNGAQWAPERLAFRVRQLSSTPSAGPALQAWLVILYVMTHNVLSNVLLTLTRMIQIPVQMVSHLANKWIFLGRVVDDGTQYPLRGRVHLAWMLVMRSSRMSALPPEMAYLFELIAAYATLLGVRVGKNLRLFPNPETMQAYPEADVITYGDDTIFSGHVYGHDFSSMHLRFKQTTIGNRVEATESWQVQVLPGSQIPDGIIMDAVGRSVFFEGLANEPNVAYRGNPARRVQ